MAGGPPSASPTCVQLRVVRYPLPAQAQRDQCLLPPCPPSRRMALEAAGNGLIPWPYLLWGIAASSSTWAKLPGPLAVYVARSPVTERNRV